MNVWVLDSENKWPRGVERVLQAVTTWVLNSEDTWPRGRVEFWPPIYVSFARGTVVLDRWSLCGSRETLREAQEDVEVELARRALEAME